MPSDVELPMMSVCHYVGELLQLLVMLVFLPFLLPIGLVFLILLGIGCGVCWLHDKAFHNYGSTWDLIYEWIQAKKQKVCPFLEWME